VVHRSKCKSNWQISPLTGQITEYNIPTNDSYPVRITAGPDGDLWFTEQNGNQIGKISSQTGQITEYSIPTPALVLLILCRLDGNLWFTEENVNNIGKYMRPQALLLNILLIINEIEKLCREYQHSTMLLR